MLSGMVCEARKGSFAWELFDFCGFLGGKELFFELSGFLGKAKKMARLTKRDRRKKPHPVCPNQDSRSRDL
jgi:hypothetical protein